MIFAITLPAALYHPGSVQTGLYIAGVSGLALYFLDRRPIVAGLLVALLAIKPHLAILWPIFFALSGRWRAFIAAAVGGDDLRRRRGGRVWGWRRGRIGWRASAARQGLIINRLVGTDLRQPVRQSAGLALAGASRAIAHGISAVAALGAASWVFWKSRDWRTSGIASFGGDAAAVARISSTTAPCSRSCGALLAPPRNKLEVAALFAAGRGAFGGGWALYLAADRAGGGVAWC